MIIFESNFKKQTMEIIKVKAEGLESFNEIHDHVENSFDKIGTGIHNFLWQVIINRVFDNEAIKTLYPVSINGAFWLCLIVKDESGYYNQRIQFKKQLSLTEISKVQDYLNDKLFDQSPAQSILISESSFL
jgi:transcriptional regulator of heat shock response